MTVEAMPQLFRLAELQRYRVSARDGKAGKLQQVYFDDQDWRVLFFMIQAGHWPLGKKVLIKPDRVERVDEENKHLLTVLDQNLIKCAVSARKLLPVSRHYEQEYRRHIELNPKTEGEAEIVWDSPIHVEGEYRTPTFPIFEAAMKYMGTTFNQRMVSAGL